MPPLCCGATCWAPAAYGHGFNRARGAYLRGLFVLVIQANVVVLEVTGELGGALVLEQPLESAPRGIAHLLTSTFGHVELFGDLVEVNIGISDERLVGFLFLEFV